MKSQDIDSVYVQNTLNLLNETRLKIVQYDGVKPREEQQIREALDLLHTHQEAAGSKREKRKSCYRQFLKRVLDVTNLKTVALCAVGLGKSRVANMRDGVRLGLPFHIKSNETLLDCTVFQTILDKIATCMSFLTTALLLPNGPQATPAVQQEDTACDTTWTNSTQPDTGNGQGSLAGRVYNLTADDVRSFVTANNNFGGVWLTDPYDVNCLPFITIQISKELSLQYATQRPQSL